MTREDVMIVICNIMASCNTRNLQGTEKYHTRKEQLGAPVANLSVQEYCAAKPL